MLKKKKKELNYTDIKNKKKTTDNTSVIKDATQSQITNKTNISDQLVSQTKYNNTSVIKDLNNHINNTKKKLTLESLTVKELRNMFKFFLNIIYNWIGWYNLK
jgi:hypothetical protein